MSDSKDRFETFYDWDARHRNERSWMAAHDSDVLPEPLAAIMSEIRRRFQEGHSYRYRFEGRVFRTHEQLRGALIETAAGAIFSLIGDFTGEPTTFERHMRETEISRTPKTDGVL